MAIIPTPTTVNSVNELLNLSHRLSKIKSPTLDPLRQQVLNALNHDDSKSNEGSNPSETLDVTDLTIIRAVYRYIKQSMEVLQFSDEPSMIRFHSDLGFLFSRILKESKLEPKSISCYKQDNSNPKGHPNPG